MSLCSFMLTMMSKGGKKSVKALEEMSKNPMEKQQQLLADILAHGQNTMYGKEHHFGEIHSVEDFQKFVPANEYDNLAPYIERMVEGQENILTDRKIVHFNRTSGTLGVEKRIPLVEEQVQAFRVYNVGYSDYLISDKLGLKWCKGKGFSLGEGTYEILPTGVSYGCASSVMTARMDKMGPFKNAMGIMYTSPREAQVPEQGVFTRYIHARFAIAEENVTYAVATFSSNLMETFRYIEHNWEMLVNDIRTGTIDESVAIPQNVRKTLLKKIKPMPERAAFLEKVFKEGFDRPIVPIIWPRFEYIYAAAGAGFQPYTDKMTERYLGPKVHVYYLGLSASEGYFSVTKELDNPDSILLPDVCFLEFIDVKAKKEEFLTMDKLEVGNDYELVITNRCGLYRYRMKDVVRVTGMYNNIPLVQFQYRAGYAINMFGEKTSELAIQHTITQTEKILGIDIVDYSVYGDVDGAKYDFLLELEKWPKELTREKLQKVIQEQIQIANEDIKEEFDLKHLKDIGIVILQPETYQLYKEKMVYKGASVSQLKPVHVIRNEFQRKFFYACEDPDITDQRFEK